MSKKIDPNVQGIVDYILDKVDMELDEDDPMSKLVNAKILEAATKMYQSQQSQELANKLNDLVAAVTRIELNQINEATQIMHQALLVMAAVVPEDGKDDIMKLAQKMATSKNTIHTGDNNTDTSIGTVIGDAAGNMDKKI